MLEKIRLVYYELRDVFAEGGLKEVIRKRVFWQRIVSPVEMNLVNLPPVREPLGSDYQFIELKLDDLHMRTLSFRVSSRGLKAACNLKKG